MSLSIAVRRLLPRHIRGCVMLSDNVSSKLNHHSCMSTYVNTQLHSVLKHGRSRLQFRKSHLFSEITNKTSWNLISNSKTLCSDTSNSIKGERKRAYLKMNDVRHDRQLCVDMFHTILEEKGDTAWTSDDWVQLGEQISTQMRGSWEIMCMHTLMMDCNLIVGRSLMEYLEERSEPPGHVITTFYIGLLGKTCRGNPEQEMEFKKYYDSLISATELFDAASIEVLVEGLSNTKFYKDCIGLLENYRLTSRPRSGILRNMLLGALRNEDLQLCSDVLRLYEEEIEPPSLTVKAPELIDVALETKNQEIIHKIFDFFNKHRLSLPRDMLEMVLQSFQRYDPGLWNGLFGFVNYASGQCSVCGHQMPRLQVGEEEFKAVQSSFLDQVIVGENIFFKTSPVEVQNFINFVNKFGPFDVVIDGMNTLFARVRKRPSEQTLKELVSYFCHSGKRVLVVGSVVLKQNARMLARIDPQPKVYMTSTTRADDAFFLYAALHSGMNTVIVSGDKLRDHKFRLDPHLQHTFHHWLASNQVYNFINFKTGAIEPKRLQFNLGPNKDNNGWHIPVFDEDAKSPFGRNGILCLRHGPENFVQAREKPFRQMENFSQTRDKPFRQMENFSQTREKPFRQMENFSQTRDKPFRQMENFSQTREKPFRQMENFSQTRDKPFRQMENFSQTRDKPFRRQDRKSKTNEKADKEWFEL